jgi:anti-anti-sigma factor
VNDPDLLAIQLTHLDGEAVLTLRGEIDLASAPRLRESILQVRERGVPVVLDMALVTFMDSSGISALIEASGVASGAPSPVQIRSPSDRVRQVLSITGLDKVFAVKP